jgi:hypothetical protein
MEIESTLTRWKYARLLVFMMARRLTMIMAAGIFVALLVLSVFYPWSFYLALIYLAVVVILYGGAIFYTTRKRINRYYFLPKQYRFNGQGVSVKTPVGDQQLKWEKFIRWQKLSDIFVLYLSEHSFVAIPQSDVPQEKLQEFITLISRNIRTRK